MMTFPLSANHLTDKVAKAFAEVLKDNGTLRHLDLSYNEFGEMGGLYLGAGLVISVPRLQYEQMEA